MSTAPLSPEEIVEAIKETPDWNPDPQVSTIARTYECKDFQRAILLVNQIANIAEEANHHPDLFIHGYKNVTVSLTTHSTGGLTEMDFAVAKSIDAIVKK